MKLLRRHARPWALWALLAQASCGYGDGGEGTGTLTVSGELDSSFASQATLIRFSVLQNATVVEDADITLQDADSHDSLRVPFDSTLGAYSGTWQGYHRKVSVHISRGADNLTARVEGPSRHTVAHPRMGATLKVQDGLDVLWATEDGVRAHSVLIHIEDDSGHVVSHALNHDSGQHQVAASSLSPGAATLTVERSELLPLKGGDQASAIVSRYSVSTNIVRQ